MASIFEVPLVELTGVYDDQALWVWLGEFFPAVGMISRTYFVLGSDQLQEVKLGSRRPEGHTNLPGLTPWIATVRSPRTPHAHCVVMVMDQLEWDPHPRRDMGVGYQIGDYAFTLDHPEKLKR